MNKKITVSTAITIAIIAMTVTFSVTMIMARQIFERTIPSVKEKESMYSKLSEIDKYVRANYYGDIQDNTLNDMIGYGYMLGTGDKNAVYYNARQFSEMLDIQNGNIMGIGVDLAKDSSGYGRITAVYEGSPAQEFNMEVGGFITSIDGAETKGMTRDAMVSKLRGEGGTNTIIGYMAPDSTTSEYTISRRSYLVPSVNYTMADGSCGYIRLFRFDSTTLNQFSRAVNDLQEQGAKSLVIDLRDNGGGLLRSALDCLDLLVPRGPTAYAEDKEGKREMLAESDSSSVELPIVVMVNRNTASSAELFAAQLREMNKAQLMGEKTMGKWSIQSEPHRMSDGSAVVLTVARMLTGSGKSYDGTGLAVDVEVAPKPGSEATEGDVKNDSMIGQAVTLAKVASGVPVDTPNLENGDEAQAEQDPGQQPSDEGETGEEE